MCAIATRYGFPGLTRTRTVASVLSRMKVVSIAFTENVREFQIYPSLTSHLCDSIKMRRYVK